jgi:hypothetical protein
MAFFAQHLAAKAHAARPGRYLDYPKALYLDGPKGEPTFVNSAEEEARALGKEPLGASDGHGGPANLIAGHAEKPRGPGRPKKLDLPEGVFDTSGAGEQQE